MSSAERSDTIIEEIAIRAPAHKVFLALTDPAQRVKWWVRSGRFQASEMESDLRPGGRWVMRGTGAGGRPFVLEGVYRQIDPPRTLVFTWRPSWQANASETLVRFDLEEAEGITTVRLTHSGLTADQRVQHEGWPDLLAQLREIAERQG